MQTEHTHKCIHKEIEAEAVSLSLEMNLQMHKQRSPQALQENNMQLLLKPRAVYRLLSVFKIRHLFRCFHASLRKQL